MGKANTIDSPFGTPSRVPSTSVANTFNLIGPEREIEGVYSVGFFRIINENTLQQEPQIGVLYNYDKYTYEYYGQYCKIKDGPDWILEKIVQLIGHMDVVDFSSWTNIPEEKIYEATGRDSISSIEGYKEIEYMQKLHTIMYQEYGLNEAIVNRPFFGVKNFKAIPRSDNPDLN